ncbi:DUF6904 family protein [Rubrivivax sp. JA1055]|uniref:DUF6904 family protein n=1 Tax=Rubrivivax sp. JA1055 TaxID=2894194 RepID=UPI001E4681B9|nr:hypothetical protein [Rubrivivax sp. JA1055]MCC9595324.1 hypothetical protein [Rubrivivax sp. JA1055]
MLVSRPTKFGAGITLGGDYLDLSSLHETVHTLASEKGPLSAHHYEFALGLAYDLRKAREGKRDRWPSDADAYVGYSAVNILWPIFLVQLGMLRAACAYMPTDRRIQAHLYSLEACAAEALTEFDPSISAMCMRWLANFNLLHDSFLMEFVTHQTREFLFGADQGKARFRRLPRLLDEISPFSQAYHEFERAVVKQAHAQGAKPQDMTDLSEWPDFKW